MRSFDPRPDLVADSPLWTDLLQRAVVKDAVECRDPANGLVAALDGVRSEGVRLRPGYPRATLEQGEELTAAEWRDRKTRYLAPQRGEIEQLLTDLMVAPLLSEFSKVGVPYPADRADSPEGLETVCRACNGAGSIVMHVDSIERGRRVGRDVRATCVRCQGTKRPLGVAR